jgi:hypothetical protein
MTRKKSPFNYNHIFVDTNVLVGGYSGDARFKRDEACLHYLYSLAGKWLYQGLPPFLQPARHQARARQVYPAVTHHHTNTH